MNQQALHVLILVSTSLLLVISFLAGVVFVHLTTARNLASRLQALQSEIDRSRATNDALSAQVGQLASALERLGSHDEI